jgi:hypothetical protein
MVLLPEHAWQSSQQLHPVQLHSLQSSLEQQLFPLLHETASMALIARINDSLMVFIFICVGLGS